MNGFNRKSDDFLATAAATASAILEKNPGYNVPAVKAEALSMAGASLSTLIDEAKTAQDAAKAATIAKANGREAALGALNAIANVVYTNGTSDPMIQALGFAPRQVPSRPVAPVVVTGVTARALPDSSIRLEFKRTGNRPTAIFQIERSFDNGATWTIVASSQATKATLTGYAPGVTVLFRVTTTNSVGTSLPSAVAGVYVGEVEASEPIALKLAA